MESCCCEAVLDAGGVAVAGAAEAEVGYARPIFKRVVEERDIEVVIGHGRAAANDHLLVQHGRHIGKAELGRDVVRLRFPQMVKPLEMMPLSSCPPDGRAPDS